VSKYLFFDDYSEGAHPEILKAINEANAGQQRGYGGDEYCQLAAERIVAELGVSADIHFISGGTQANIVGMSALLRPHHGVIAVASAHIAQHEAGGIEATGHKIIAINSPDGKLTPELVDQGMATHYDEHTVKPRVVFVSQATELGTVYTRQELTTVVDHAHQKGLLVYLDGARLAEACAAMSPATTLADIAQTGVDILYIGGTKNGGLFGEAIAVINAGLREDFRYLMKQRGALMAKARVMGAQFARFFDEDRLWYQLGRVANDNARTLTDGLIAAGYEFVVPTETNQLFPRLPVQTVVRLEKEFGFYRWDSGREDPATIRLVCSWATSAEEIRRFVEATAREVVS
jgi:threonine aldolase